MRSPRFELVFLFAVSLSACLAGCAGIFAKPAATRTGWDAVAMKTAEDLAAKLRAAGIPCEDFTVEPFSQYQSLYGSGEKFPIADAVATCDSAPFVDEAEDTASEEGEEEEKESLMFEVFADVKATRHFLDAKQKTICFNVAKQKLLVANFPGFPYVDGGSWLIEPDNIQTARKIATALGATAKQERCP